MDPQQKVRISRAELATLRQIGGGIAKESELVAWHVEQLTRLGLIGRDGEGLGLTDLGRQRLAGGASRSKANPISGILSPLLKPAG
jgi:hypothetical protein